MSTKEIKSDTLATLRGIKKVYKVTIGVVEALAWGGLLAIAYTVIGKNLKGDLALPDITFALVVLSAAAITLRLLIEGTKYFRSLGEQE